MRPPRARAIEGKRTHTGFHRVEYVKRATRAASTTFDDAFAPAALTRAR